jgi:hypothetical protein
MIGFIQYWWIGVIALMLAVIGVEHWQVETYRAKVISLQTAIADSNQKALVEHTQAQKITDTINEQYQNSQTTVNQLSNDIRQWVLRYEAQRAATPHPSTPAPAPANPAGSLAPATPVSPTVNATDELIANTIAACERDSARFKALQDWARELSSP